MKINASLLVLALGLSSCEYYQSPIFYRISANGVPEQDIDIEFETMEQAWKWIDDSIEYKIDNPDYKQTPEETYRLRTGDCEDHALLMSYFGYMLGLDIKLVRIYTDKGPHIINKYDGIYFEPQTYPKIYFEKYLDIGQVWDYESAFYDSRIRTIKY